MISLLAASPQREGLMSRTASTPSFPHLVSPSPRPRINTADNMEDETILDTNTTNNITTTTAASIRRRKDWLLHAQVIPANVYVQQRSGVILSRSMILKADIFTSALTTAVSAANTNNDVTMTSVDPQLLGAPNMQQIKPFLIFGVGQPTVSGIRAMMNLIKAKHPFKRHVSWICLREEPVVYLNNRPFVLRELEYPFHNMVDFAGIEASRLNDIESRLKIDILNEAEQHDGNILVHDEIIMSESRACWESVDRLTVRTSQEVFHQLESEGYQVEYVRIPITAESVMDAKQVDAIITALIKSIDSEKEAHKQHLLLQRTMSTPSLHVLPFTSQSSSAAATQQHQENIHIHTFNCQLGRGRSTTGMIIAYLLECHLLNQSPSHFVHINTPRTQQTPHTITTPHTAAVNVQSDSHSSDYQFAAYLRGEWDVILKLVRMLNNGLMAKSYVDEAIDACGRVHHLRQAIVHAFIRSEHARGQTQYRSLNSETVAAMKRYFYLICFQSWLSTTPIEINAEYLIQSHNTFSHFLRSHPELTKLANSLIQEDSVMETAVRDQSTAIDECPTIDRAVFSRSGSVLSRRTIIKSEFFAISNQKRQRIELSTGMSHYRHIESLPLSATAQPDVADIRRILNDLCNETRSNKSSSDIQDTSSTSIIWINFREEPVIFLQSQPFLLRDYFHPFRILSEFTTGMTADRCDQIEKRLKEDIIQEWRSEQHHIPQHQVLVHDETKYQQIAARYLTLESEQEIQSTREVYDLMQNEGYKVAYHRVPLHTEEVPSVQSFDRVFSILNAQPLMIPIESMDSSSELQYGGVSIVFNDQKGGRRTTMGLVIACLTLIHQGSIDLTETPHELQNNVNGNLINTDNVSIPNTSIARPSTPPKKSPVTSPALKGQSFNGGTPPIPALKRTPSTVIEVDSSVRAAERLHTGRAEYKGILNLIRILKKGRSVKEEVDTVIDLCGSELNLRSAIAAALKQHDLDRTGNTHKSELEEAVKHCESYALIIIFNAYLHERREKWEEEQIAKQTNGDNNQHTETGSTTNINASAAVATNEGIEAAPQSLSSSSPAHRPRPSVEGEIDAGQLVNYNLFNPYINDAQTQEQRQQAQTQIQPESFIQPEVSPAADSPMDVVDAVSSSPINVDHSSSLFADFSFPSFTSWLHHRPELSLALDFIRNEPEEAFKLNQTMINEEFASAFERRNGNVLVRGSLLKSDHFTGVMNKNVVQMIEGAINFRPIEEFTVAGTGIPTAEGIARILDFYISIANDNEPDPSKPTSPFRASSLLWLNLREEPLLYVNHRPFVLRDGDNPYNNLENTGITPRRVEAMEKTLKMDAWNEVLQSDNKQKLLLHDEDENGNLFAYYETVSNIESLRTPKEEFDTVFIYVQESCAKASPSYTFNASYYRTPITDEQAPSPASVDAMVRYLEAGRPDPHRALIMNCQMGRGRTTTGLIIACLWAIHRLPTQHEAWKKIRQQQHATQKQNNIIANTSTSSISATHAVSITTVNDPFAASLRAGWWKLIVALIRVLPNGRSVKQLVDHVIYHCASMQNLREVVYDIQLTALSTLPRKKSFFVRRGTNYLIRYFFLICIAAYLEEEKVAAYKTPFGTWLNQRQEILSLLKRVEFPQLETTGSKSDDTTTAITTTTNETANKTTVKK